MTENWVGCAILSKLCSVFSIFRRFYDSEGSGAPSKWDFASELNAPVHVLFQLSNQNTHFKQNPNKTAPEKSSFTFILLALSNRTFSSTTNQIERIQIIIFDLWWTNRRNSTYHTIKALQKLKKTLTDTGEDSKLVHRRKRPKVDTLFYSLFFRRVRATSMTQRRVENTRVLFWTFSPVSVKRYFIDWLIIIDYKYYWMFLNWSISMTFFDFLRMNFVKDFQISICLHHMTTRLWNEKF